MAYANGTTHYNLPLTVGSDKRDWADTNKAFSDIDAAIYGAVTDTGTQEEEISALETRMDTAEQNISGNASDIAALDTRLTTAEGSITSQAAAITDVRSDSEDMICAYNEATATSTHAYAIGDYFIYNDVLYRATANIGIGDTIVPDTNCTTTNITTEIKNSVGDIDDFKNNNLITNLAESYNSTATYSINDVVSFVDTNKIGKLYRCITNINTPETFNPSHWVEVNCTDVFAGSMFLLKTHTTSAGETWRDVLNSLAISDTSKYQDYKVVIDYGNSMNILSTAVIDTNSNYLNCSFVKSSSTAFDLNSMYINDTGSVYSTIHIESSGSVTNLSNTAVGADVTISIYGSKKF